MGSATAANPTMRATIATAKAVLGETDHSELSLPLNWIAKRLMGNYLRDGPNLFGKIT